MKNIENNESLNTTNNFFDYTFEKLDLNKELEKLYEIINDEELQDEYQKKVKLSNLRNENHKRYYNIDILKYKDLPMDFIDIVEDILNLYTCIEYKQILTDNSFDSNNTKIILDNIYRRIDKLDRMVNTYLKEITKKNDKHQSKFSIAYFNNLDIQSELRNDLLNKYNTLVLYSSVFTEDIYEDLQRQIKREENISDILRLLNIEEEKKINLQKKDKLKIMNKKIDFLISTYKQQIQYLEDIILSNSKYVNEFKSFKDFCYKIFAYDDESYDNTKQTYEILSDKLRFQNYISNFEEMFIQEINDKEREKKFIFEKIGIKNLKNSLNYITANYIGLLDDEKKNVISDIYKNLNNDYFDLEELNNLLGLIVRDIWNKTITDIYSFNPNEDYYFICSNNQFIDEKYQTILLSKKEIDRVEDYEDYQIGFICGYNDNILYITENDDIMSVSDFDDMSNLKTPLQLEQEFINFKVSNRIALNGYKTKIEAVYFINDGNFYKYKKALELANQYNLPLLELKKTI